MSLGGILLVLQSAGTFARGVSRFPLFDNRGALALQNRLDESAAVRQQIRSVWGSPDLNLTTSCPCQPGA
jgi:hypothetical protein